MKHLSLFLVTLIFFHNIISSQDDDFSIIAFLNYLEENGYFEIISRIKYSFGVDPAIDFCKDLFPTKDCEEIVNNYIIIRRCRPIVPEALEDIIFQNLEILLTIKTNKEILDIISKLKEKYNIKK